MRPAAGLPEPKLKNNPMHSSRGQRYQWLGFTLGRLLILRNRFDSSGKTLA
jgi:hypothetical protein